MRFYEVVFILRQDVQPQEVESKVDALMNIIESNGGTLLLKEMWGLRSLEYEVRKNKKGWYIMLQIESTSDVVSELESHCKLSEDIIRYLIMRKDEKPTSEPSEIMQLLQSAQEKAV